MKRYSTSGIFREMIEKNHMRYHFMCITVDIIKTPENNKCWWGCREIITLVPCLGNENDRTTMENSIVVPQKIEHRITIWSSNSTSEYMSKQIESKLSSYLYILLHSNIFHTAKKWEQSKYSSADEWIKCAIYTVEYYSALIRKFWHMLQHGWTLRPLC